MPKTIELNFKKIFLSLTWGVIEVTITPISPAHWLAENLDKATPIPIFPPTAIAAARGSQELAISEPYFTAE